VRVAHQTLVCIHFLRTCTSVALSAYLAVVARGHEQVARVGEPPQSLHPLVVALVPVDQLLGQVAVVDRVPFGRERAQPQGGSTPRSPLVVHFGALLAVELGGRFPRRGVFGVARGQQVAAD